MYHLSLILECILHVTKGENKINKSGANCFNYNSLLLPATYANTMLAQKL